MNNGTYMDIVGVHYKDIKTLFKSRLHNNEQQFDEDSFNDAFIKCANRFGNAIITYDNAVRYFWVAYVNTVKGTRSKALSRLMESLDDEELDCIDDDDPTFAKHIYNIIMAAITEAFSEEDMMIYSLYKYHNWTEKDLTDAGYDCKNLEIRIKTIHKFVKAYSKKNMKSL